MKQSDLCIEEHRLDFVLIACGWDDDDFINELGFKKI